MVRHIHTSIVMNASLQKVWNILTEFEDYKRWNPFILSAKGQLKEGAQLEIEIRRGRSKSMKFKPVITALKPFKQLSWVGRLGIKGLFDGAHSFVLKDNNDGTVSFEHSERFSGILVWMLDIDHTTQGFMHMNECLKKLVETD